MKRLLLPLLAALALPTAISANDLIDKYNQQIEEKNICRYYRKNINWIKSEDYSWNEYYFLKKNNEIIEVYRIHGGWKCKKVGKLMENYTYRDDNVLITNYFIFENGYLVKYRERHGYVNKTILKRYQNDREN